MINKCKALLDRGNEAKKETAPVAEHEIRNESGPNHNLALAVGNEIFRIRKRLKKMPKNIKGVKPIQHALDRLESVFNENGYTLLELEGKPYSDGLNVNADFVTSNEIDQGEQIITLVIKPQINFNGVLIQQADIEVTIGEE